jgi:hypothetical protein
MKVRFREVTNLPNYPFRHQPEGLADRNVVMTWLWTHRSNVSASDTRLKDLRIPEDDRLLQHSVSLIPFQAVFSAIELSRISIQTCKIREWSKNEACLWRQASSGLTALNAFFLTVVPETCLNHSKDSRRRYKITRSRIEIYSANPEIWNKQEHDFGLLDNWKVYWRICKIPGDWSVHVEMSGEALFYIWR